MFICAVINDRRICWRVPLLTLPPWVPVHPELKPQPDPWIPQTEPWNPTPDPWITFEGLTPDLALQIQAVATLEEVAQHLPEEHLAAARELVQASVNAIGRRLPGLTVQESYQALEQHG
jgi:hypothetical protein